ncbi:MAG TPA: hypothetical protein VFN77_05455, partial [Acetobacteraceae bacterium]|nr:hypothetical protein [Acetobacteraceae bacterium]
LPQRYDYTLNGGRTWIPAGGFAHDNGAWDSWVYNLKLPPGTYTVAIRDHANPSQIVVAPGTYTVTSNTAPGEISFHPIRFSTSLPTGSIIGVIAATGGTPHFPLALKAAEGNSPGYAVTPLGNGKWQVSVADQDRLTAGENRLAGRIASGRLSRPFSFTFPVAQGHVVPASAMRFRQAPGLTNATPVGSHAFTVGISGYSGGAFSILAQDAPADPASHMAARYTLDGTSGKTSNTLSAQRETIKLCWTDGVNTCVAEQVLAIGNVLNTGPVIHVANQVALARKMAWVQGNALGRYKGAVVMLAPGAYNSGWTMPGAADGWNGDGFFGPQTIKGGRGLMPVLEQTGPWIPNAKGWLETLGWDLEVAGLEFANLAQSYPGEVGNFAGIKLNAGCLGKTIIRFIYSHNCTNGVLGGQPGQIVVITDSEFAKNGGGDGFTHNFYLAAVSWAEIRRVVSWGANVGHCGKIRAAKGLVDSSVFADGPTGCASYLLDLPDGGVHTVSNTILDKGPHAQNGPLLRYGEECQNRHPVNRLLVEGCTFINRVGSADKLYNGDYVQPVPVQFGLASGGKATAMIRNCTFYGFTKSQAFRTDGPNARVVMGGGNRFLPLSEAPDPSSYMTHPWQKGGYSSASGAPGPYRAGPMAGH